MPSFSIVIIARNEELRIGSTLSAPGVAAHLARGGDVLIADTGSTDRTAEVAQSHGARVALLGTAFSRVLTKKEARIINKKFVKEPDKAIVRGGEAYFHFADARNAAAAHALHDMQLQIDTCDMLEALDGEAIDAHIAAGVTRFRYTHYLGLGDASQVINRLYDRRGAHWQGCVHEVLYDLPKSASGNTVDNVWCDLPEAQLRVRYLRNEGKKRPYHIGMALDMLKGDNPRWYHYLGREFMYNGMWTSAIALLSAQADRADAWHTERAQSCWMAGQCHEHLNNIEGALFMYMKAHLIDSMQRTPLMLIARVHFRIEKSLPDTKYAEKQRHMQAAASYAKAALAVPRTCALSEAEDMYREGPHRMLMWAYQWMGRPDKAKYHWLMACHYFPTNTELKEEGRFFENVVAALNTDEDGLDGYRVALEANRAAFTEVCSAGPAAGPDPQP